MTVAKLWDGSSWITPSAWNRPRVWTGSAWKSYDFSESSSASNISTTMTVGFRSVAPSKFGPGGDYTGFSINPSMGSMASRLVGIPWQNVIIDDLYWQTDGFPSGPGLYYNISSTTTPTSAIKNSGWNTITINGVTFNRSSASFFSLPPTEYSGYWFWSGGSNPFPAAGNTTTITWS